METMMTVSGVGFFLCSIVSFKDSVKPIKDEDSNELQGVTIAVDYVVKGIVILGLGIGILLAKANLF